MIDVGRLGSESESQIHRLSHRLRGPCLSAYGRGAADGDDAPENSYPDGISGTGRSPTLALIHDWKGTGQPWLGIPQFGQLMLYPIARLGPRNQGSLVKLYQPTVLFGGERENRLIRDYALQLIYRLPQIGVWDFNGDGRADLIASWQDHVAVYLPERHRPLPQEPSQTFHFNLRTEQERTLRLVQISPPLIEDLDGDGRADLILTKMTGRLTDRRLVTSVYLNRAGNLPAQPDVRIEHDGFATTLLTKDLNGDGKHDLLFPLVKISVRNLIRNLLTDRADVSLLVHLYRDQGIYANTPDWMRSFSYQIDLSDGVVLQGRWPNIDGDFDGDGKADLLVAGNDEVAVYLATPGTLFARDPTARVAVKTSSHVIVRDLTESRRADIVIWYHGPSGMERAVKVLMNTATSLGVVGGPWLGVPPQGLVASRISSPAATVLQASCTSREIPPGSARTKGWGTARHLCGYL